jgi:prepilin-type N-terminal cleavage/methylation domain-containing protein
MTRAKASTTNLPRGRSRGGRNSRALGLTLVELLITLVVISILAAMLVPQMGQQIPDQLTAVAEIVAADLDYARSLAVINNSKYCLTFEPDENRYVLRHSGANTLLHVLPASPFRQTTDAPDQQTTELDDLPLTQPTVRLLEVLSDNGTLAVESDLEFTPLGGTTRSATTVVWLACGGGADERFVPIRVNPATGLVEIGALCNSLPAGVAAVVDQGP